MEEGFFGEAPTQERFVILNDAAQVVPEGSFRVIGKEKRTGKTGKLFPVVKFENEKGDRVSVACWRRDVAKVIEQYGENPDGWREVKFERGQYGRIVLLPSELPPIVQNL